jgi:hypothetical protein
MTNNTNHTITVNLIDVIKAGRPWHRLPERKHSHYNVKPRYTAGSPAGVDETTALHQAAEEHEFHAMHLSGVFGEANAAEARAAGVGPRKGPDGLLYSPAEYVEEHNNHWLVQCLCTGTLFKRPFAWQENRQRTCKRCIAAAESVSRIS